MTKAATLLSAACLASVLLVYPDVAAAWCQMTTVAPAADQACSSEGIPLHWQRRCIEYALDTNGSSDLPLSEVSTLVAESFGPWLAIECGGEPPGFAVREADFLVECQDSRYTEDGANVNVVAFVPELEDPSVLAVTVAWYSSRSGEIFDADVLVNESQGPFADCLTTSCKGPRAAHDLANVLTHEIGHFFGLGHSTVLDATMYASSTAGETTKRSLTADDEAGLCATYEVHALPAECEFTPNGGRTLACTGSSGGCGVSGPSAGPAALPWFPALLVIAALSLSLARRRARTRKGASAVGAPSTTLRHRD